MPFYDDNILNRNIEKLMKMHNMKQKELSEIIDLDQSNISNILNPETKRSFTLNQVVGIAKHFNVSIESLLGNQKDINQRLSPREIFKFIVKLVEFNQIKTFPYPVTEKETTYDYHNNQKITNDKKIVYNAFYLPSYWYIPQNATHDEEMELLEEMEIWGNLSSNITTNSFIEAFLQIHKLYEKNSLDENSYKIILDSLINQLSNDPHDL